MRSPGDDLAGRLGIFARTFVRDGPVAVADAVARTGYRVVHWNFSAIRQPTLAGHLTAASFDEVRAAFDGRGLTLASVSATFNAIHPNPVFRRDQVRLAAGLIGRVPRLGGVVVTICTGTRDTSDMWRAHPDNTTRTAWHDLRETLDVLLDAAAAAGVVVGIEPEAGNVVRDAPTAARLLDELGDAPVGIVLDPANLLTPRTASRQQQIVARALDLLGPRVVGVQLKDVVSQGYAAAGRGLIDFPTLFEQLGHLEPVPWVVQDSTEADAARVRHDVLRWYAEAFA